MTASIFGEYVDALVTALQARPGLTGVQIAPAPLGDNVKTREYMAVVGAPRIEFNWSAMPRGMDEECRIEVALYVLKPGQNDLVARSARDRALALLAEVQTALTDNPRLIPNVTDSRVELASMIQGFNSDGRTCSITYYVFVRARIN